MRIVPRFLVAAAIGLAVLSFKPVPAAATPLDRWKVSCGADRGAIRHKGGVWTFKTSSNHCEGGIFNQRAEISSDKIKPSHKGAYRFTTHVALTSPSTQKFGIFQIHDGRYGCAPPLKLEVLPSGHLVLESDYKIGSAPGNNCRHNLGISKGRSAARLPRDGSEHRLDVTIAFDGQGGFSIWVALDGRPQIKGRYEHAAGYFKSKFFYFKHGVYSQHMFPYELRSRDMNVRKVRLAN